jgi:hypothetical protein
MGVSLFGKSKSNKFERAKFLLPIKTELRAGLIWFVLEANAPRHLKHIEGVCLKYDLNDDDDELDLPCVLTIQRVVYLLHEEAYLIVLSLVEVDQKLGTKLAHVLLKTGWERVEKMPLFEQLT